MEILMVMTSHEQLGNSDKKAGLWLEEFAAAYYVFKDAGADIMLATTQGDMPPIDPNSVEPEALTHATERLFADAAAKAQLACTHEVKDFIVAEFDAIFYPGGHGPLWDLVDNPDSIRLIEGMFAAHKPVALVCHAPGVLRNVKGPDGQPVVQGKRVTGFSNSEEAAVGLTDVVPFLVEDMLKANGGDYHKADDWQPHVEVDGLLVTGQNPASSTATAEALLAILQRPIH